MSIEYATQQVPYLRKICQPLFDTFGLKSFGYKRLLPGGKYLFLSTNKNWVEYHIKSVKSHGSFFSKALKETHTDHYHCVIWPDIPSDYFLEALKQHGMWHGINFYKKNLDSIELWTFSTSPDNENIKDTHLDNIDEYKKFIRFFRGISKDIINVDSASQFATIPNCDYEIKSDSLDVEKMEKKKIFIDSISRLTHLMINDKVTPLAPREAECLYYLSEGFSTKEISRILNLAPKTIDFYIENMKTKTGLVSRNLLIHAYFETFYGS